MNGPREDGRAQSGKALCVFTTHTPVLSLYHDQDHGWPQLTRSTIAFDASFFNTQWMLQQYAGVARPE